MKKTKHPSEDAFLTNPVASAKDATGFAPTLPKTEFEAEQLSDMFYQVPVTSHKKTKRDKYKEMTK